MLVDKQPGDKLQAHRQPGGKQAGGQIIVADRQLGEKQPGDLRSAHKQDYRHKQAGVNQTKPGDRQPGDRQPGDIQQDETHRAHG